MTIEIYEKSDIIDFDYYVSQVEFKSYGLWYGDLEEAGIDRVYFAFDDDEVVGFQTINSDGFCVAIETFESHQGRGIARALIEESGCYRPERNENREFWLKMEEIFGD